MALNKLLVSFITDYAGTWSKKKEMNQDGYCFACFFVVEGWIMEKVAHVH